MISRKASLSFLFSLLFLFSSGFALAQEKINSLDVSAQIEENGTVLVQETIIYDFGTDYKHGIYRDIYAKNIEVQVKSVLMDGTEWKYEIINSSNNVRVKIGDPRLTISGIHTYSIVYLVKGAVKFLPDHDEFYWNVTGNNWAVPIEIASINIDFPLVEDFLGGKNLKCYTGQFGSAREDCQYFFDGTAHFKTTQLLNAGEGLTIVFGWPKGVVLPPSALEKAADFAKKYWPFVLPILVFVCLFWVWLKKGNDPSIKKSIVVQYGLPKDLRPIEVAYILHQKITPRDISATIVDLAVKGYLKIKETETKKFFSKQKDWILIKQKEFANDQTLEPFEKRLLTGIFSPSNEAVLSDSSSRFKNILQKRFSNTEIVEQFRESLSPEASLAKNEVAISSLKEKFYRDVESIKDLASKEMVLDDYFTTEPSKTKRKYLSIGFVTVIAIAFILKYIVGFSSYFLGWQLWLIIAVCGLIIMVFSAVMPKKTMKGTETLWHILGFREYITKAEKYRAQFQEKENIFEKFLPFAIIFNCTKKWAKAFEGIYKTPPAWYEGVVYGAYFSTTDFSKSLDSSISGIGGALAATPGGSGSGFSGGSSGGGFGGGGGGSW